MRRALLLAALLAVPAAAQDGADLLDRFEGHLRDGVRATWTLAIGERPTRGTLAAADGALRLDSQDGRTVVLTERGGWYVDEQAGLAAELPAVAVRGGLPAPVALVVFFDRERYRTRSAETTDVDGQPAVRFELEARAEGAPGARLWLHRETGAPLRVEVLDGGRPAGSLQLADLALGGVDRGAFRVEPPRGVEVVRL